MAVRRQRFTDDFNRADGTLGANYATSAGNYGVTSNKAHATTDHSRSSLLASAQGTFGLKQISQVTLSGVGTALNDGQGPSILIGGGAGTDDTGIDAYLSTAGCRIYRCVAGVFTILTDTTGTTWATSDVAFLEYDPQSQTISLRKATIDSAAVLSIADGTIEFGQPGFQYGSASSIDIDNFFAFDYVADPSGTPPPFLEGGFTDDEGVGLYELISVSNWRGNPAQIVEKWFADELEPAAAAAAGFHARYYFDMIGQSRV